MREDSQHRPHLHHFTTPTDLELLGCMNEGFSGVVPRKNKQTLLLGPEEAQLGLSGRESQGGTTFELSAQTSKENIALGGVGSWSEAGAGARAGSVDTAQEWE